MSAERVADLNFILVTYERADEVRQVIEHLLEHARSEHQLTIIDNHSGPEVQTLLRDVRRWRPDCRIVRNAENRFCGGASNQALALTREPFAVYLCAHECFVFQDGFDLRCLEYMQAHPEVAQAGHLIGSPAYATGRGYQTLECFDRFRNPHYAEERADEPFVHVQGGFYVLRMQAVHDSGGFNPRILHDYMDVEFSYFLESEGWLLADLPFVMSVHRNTRPGLCGYDPEVSVYHPLTPAEAIRYRIDQARIPAAASDPSASRAKRAPASSAREERAVPDRRSGPSVS